jgi:poly-gamma-glutamate synthase PgsB/CapB
MRVLLTCVISFLLFLIYERVSLHRCRRRIRLCVTVTGTRGKSSVTRLLASILREDGRRVLAKTTGSEAVILLPDGGQVELDRSVTPSILEQKQLVKKAARLDADCLVAEVMSIRPESHYIESRHILKPNVVAITNVRRDHTEIMGETEDAIASVLSLDISPLSTVFLPEKINHASFRAEAERCHANLIPVKAGSSSPLLRSAPDLGQIEFPDNLDLVYAVSAYFGINEQKIIEGVRKAQHDVGRLGVWLYRPGDRQRTCYLVNAFAANDPESTFQVLSRVTDMLPSASGNIIGILNVRPDRLPRTVQWISVLRDGAVHRFKQLFVTGDHAGIVKRRLPEARVLKGRSPEAMMETVCAQAPEPAIIFGFGNVKGSGKLLAEHWSRIGQPYDS